MSLLEALFTDVGNWTDPKYEDPSRVRTPVDLLLRPSVPYSSKSMSGRPDFWTRLNWTLRPRGHHPNLGGCPGSGPPGGETGTGDDLYEPKTKKKGFL